MHIRTFPDLAQFFAYQLPNTNFSVLQYNPVHSCFWITLIVHAALSACHKNENVKNTKEGIKVTHCNQTSVEWLLNCISLTIFSEAPWTYTWWIKDVNSNCYCMSLFQTTFCKCLHSWYFPAVSWFSLS